MKTSLKPIRGEQAAKCALCLCLLFFSTAGVIVPPAPAAKPVVVTLPASVNGTKIQAALDALPERGGEVVLAPGTFEVHQPIVLRRDHQTLRGSGTETVLHLADGANCPVVVMGEAVNHPQRTVRFLRVADLFIDGNRYHQQRELWRLQGEGSEIRNNGITVQNVSDAVVERVTCARCRSGGLVSTLGVQRLTVRDLTAFDSAFDGLACYDTTRSLFTGLYLHDNPSAGISLDLAFNRNVISNAVLVANRLGIFMRESCGNRFYSISIHDSSEYGVFMAHSVKRTATGWEVIPQTECEQNYFTNLVAADCGSADFWINNITCTNNVVTGTRFDDGVRGELTLSHPAWPAVQ